MHKVDSYRYNAVPNDASFLYNGTDEYLTKAGLTWSSVITDGNDHTFSIWYYPTLTGNHTLFAGRASGASFFYVRYTNAGIVVQFYNGGVTADYLIPNGVGTNTWHHFMFVRKQAATPFLFYHDGVLQSPTVTVANTGGNMAGIGGDIFIGVYALLTNPFPGNLDHFACWNADVSSEIGDILDGTPGSPKDLMAMATQPVLWYQMNAEDDLEIADGIIDAVSGGANNITAVGMTNAANKDLINFP